MNFIQVHWPPPAATVDSGPQVPILTGAFLNLVDCATWPDWIICCKETTILHRWGPGEYLALVNMNVGFIDLEVILYVYIFDHVEKDGSFGGVVAGGDRIRNASTMAGGSGDGDHILGVSIPKKEGGWLRRFRLQVDVDYAVKHVHVGSDGKSAKMQFVLSTDEHCPRDWMVKYIFSALAKRTMPMLARSVAKAELAVKRGVSWAVCPDDADDVSAACAKVKFFERIFQRALAAANGAKCVERSSR